MATARTNYYCHKCHKYIRNLINSQCPDCREEFIEEASSIRSDSPSIFRRNRFDGRRGTTIADGTIFLHGFPNETNNNNNDDDDGDDDEVENRTHRHGSNQFVDPFLFHLLSQTSDQTNRGGVNAFLAQLFNQMLVRSNEEEGVPPASQNQIDSIPNVRINDKQIHEHLQCSICMEEFLLDQRVKRLSCSHHFHDECISNWLRLHGTCPTCRIDIHNDKSSSSRYSFH